MNKNAGVCVRTIEPAHDGTVRCLAQFYLSGELVIASGGVDSKVKIWRGEGIT